MSLSSLATGRRPSSNDDDGRPPSKRIRLIGNDEGIGHPIEDDATARRKLRDAGFDPDQLSKRVRCKKLPGGFGGGTMKITAMIYFSYMGDLPMCRYLLVHGAKSDLTRSCSDGFWFPMYAAAQKGHLALCQWLRDRGAEKDVYRRCGTRYKKNHCWSPLKASLINGHLNVSQWLILNGALHPGGAFKVKSAMRDLVAHVEMLSMELNVSSLKSWALNAVDCHAPFRTFLLGTLPMRANDCSAAVQSILSRNLRSEKAARLIIDRTMPEDLVILLHELSSPLHVLSGFPEILELVSDFVGIVKRRSDRDRIRDLAEFFSKLPARESEEAKRDDSSESEFDDISTDDSSTGDDASVASSVGEF